MTSLRFWVLFLGLVAALLLLAVGISFLMDWLDKRKRERDVAMEEKKPTPLYHLPGCRCVLAADGRLLYGARDCQNLTRLAVAIEKKKLSQKKNEPGDSPARIPTLPTLRN